MTLNRLAHPFDRFWLIFWMMWVSSLLMQIRVFGGDQPSKEMEKSILNNLNLRRRFIGYQHGP